MLFMRMMTEGGPVMWLLLGCGLLGLFLFLMKTFQFHREEINVRELIKGLQNVLKRDGFIEAISLCDNTPGPVARVVGALILAFERGDEDLRQAVDDACLEELPKLERHIGTIGTIGYIVPLLGFFGTVLGMMKAFQTIHATESVYLSAAQLSGAINMALITTAFGLALAIPCYVGYNYLVSRTNAITLDMEKAAAELLGFFERRRKQQEQETDEDGLRES
ncbi:MAG: MotA/TolQ/ExbB proton channel family protein [Lentisphaeria bacterium]|nr:MotA/TolQ/ExbB proton channel family protein [Lentisphaeria bacterium]